jgi:hypothetical protein
MSTGSPVEHYVTLFDHKFLPSGLALHASLTRHARPFKLWVVCMDEKAEEQLRALGLPDAEPIPLREFETPELLKVKPGRSRGEYCWTCTPFTFTAVFARVPEARRVTYLDADLYFFGEPARLLSEFERSGKSVLITDHAYDPAYDQGPEHGRFCVQFLACNNDAGGRKVALWWQARCLEWCFNRVEDGKFGDQKYLDSWPERFADEVHVLKQTRETLAPWNVRMFLGREGFRRPVLYHFHSLRITDPDRVVLWTGYDVGPHAETLYAEYLAELKAALARLRAIGAGVPSLPQTTLRARLKTVKNLVLRRYRAAALA